MKKLLKSLLIYSCILLAVAGAIYFSALYYGQQTLHVAKKQWNPANPEEVGVNRSRLKTAAEYIDARLPSARGLIIFKAGRTVLEKYYWKGGPEETDLLHSMNRFVLEILVGIAIQEQLLSDPEQPVSDFFPDFFRQGPRPGEAALTIEDLLQLQAPLIWGDDTPDYWELFYENDRISAAISILTAHKASPHPTANFAANYLLAEIIAKVSAMNIFAFADSRLFTPMEITTWSGIKDADVLGDTFIGFQLKTLDLAKLGYLVMHEGRWHGKQLVPQAWIQERRGRFQANSSGKRAAAFQVKLIDGIESHIATGEGGQFILFAPELDLVIAVSSKSQFPLSQITGYDSLFELIINACREIVNNGMADEPIKDRYRPPNLVFATRVPEDIQQFFNDFALSIATNDIKRVAYHYAKGYQQFDHRYILTAKVSAYEFWGKIFNGGSGELQSVQIDKIRVEKNRAYMRGLLKYSYHNMNEGSVGWFPLENLIKLQGRWRWLGSPTYAAILDRDEYFDVEAPPDVNEFFEKCSGAFVDSGRPENRGCFSEDFLYNGMDRQQLQARVLPFITAKNAMLHFTLLQQSGNTRFVDGYYEGSMIGALQIPPKIRIGKENGQWRWIGNGNK